MNKTFDHARNFMFCDPECRDITGGATSLEGGILYLLDMNQDLRPSTICAYTLGLFLRIKGQMDSRYEKCCMLCTSIFCMLCTNKNAQ